MRSLRCANAYSESLKDNCRLMNNPKLHQITTDIVHTTCNDKYVNTNDEIFNILWLYDVIMTILWYDYTLTNDDMMLDQNSW